MKKVWPSLITPLQWTVQLLRFEMTTAWQFCSSFHTVECAGNHWCLWELRWGKKIFLSTHFCPVPLLYGLKTESPTTSLSLPGPIPGCRVSGSLLLVQVIKITFKRFLFLIVFCRVGLPKNRRMDCPLLGSTGSTCSLQGGRRIQELQEKRKYRKSEKEYVV